MNPLYHIYPSRAPSLSGLAAIVAAVMIMLQLLPASAQSDNDNFRETGINISRWPSGGDVEELSTSEENFLDDLVNFNPQQSDRLRTELARQDNVRDRLQTIFNELVVADDAKYLAQQALEQGLGSNELASRAISQRNLFMRLLLNYLDSYRPISVRDQLWDALAQWFAERNLRRGREAEALLPYRHELSDQSDKSTNPKKDPDDAKMINKLSGEWEWCFGTPVVCSIHIISHDLKTGKVLMHAKTTPPELEMVGEAVAGALTGSIKFRTRTASGVQCPDFWAEWQGTASDDFDEITAQQRIVLPASSEDQCQFAEGDWFPQIHTLTRLKN